MDPVLDSILAAADHELLAYIRASTDPEERNGAPKA
jgi:hypothetical protein